jgi:hypothetical protein
MTVEGSAISVTGSEASAEAGEEDDRTDHNTPLVRRSLFLCLMPVVPKCDCRKFAFLRLTVALRFKNLIQEGPADAMVRFVPILLHHLA